MFKRALHKAIGPPLPAEPERTYCARDHIVESLIHQVDPSWSLDEPRDHINLIPDPVTGHIVRAELWQS